MSRPLITRQRFLALAGDTATAAAGAGGLLLASRDAPSSTVGPDSPRVAAVEQRRRGRGAAVTDVAFAAAPLVAGAGAGRGQTWAYGETVPGPEIRLRAGDVLRAAFTNDLPEPTTVHWHGIALRNDMDGVPGVTQSAVEPGGRFDYEFTVPDPGTYFLHPHVGPQLDRGLYAPLIIEDPDEPGDYDRELVLVLDDWLDGGDPNEILTGLRHAGRGGMDPMDMGSGDTGVDMDMGDGMDLGPSGLGMDVGDVEYATYVINGRPPEDPFTFEARRGKRVPLSSRDSSSPSTISAPPMPSRCRRAAPTRASCSAREGERVRLRFENHSPMFHPMHLHGHTFQVARADGPGARKDTAIIRPGETIDTDFEADNPGLWALHCHNIYHAEAGMMAVLSYVR